jgi:D-cysteine desulfhydrase family pyridoxal phosphate-dependent enzyme
MKQNMQQLLSAVPVKKLSFLPTPLQKLENLSAHLGVNLYMKRDDMTGMSQFGGNKIRKLEYLLGQAIAEGCDTVFTYGATQSNHAMQTVTACRRAGLTPILYLVAIVEPDESDLRANLLLDRILGAEVHIIRPRAGETEEEAEERSYVMAREHMARLHAQGRRCYDIPMGGANGTGSAGFIQGYLELRGQMDALGIQADWLFHATGTGGTLAGLAAGRNLCGSDTRIVSVHVSEKDLSYRKKVERMANEALAYIGAGDCMVDGERDLCCDLNYYQPGYEIPNEAASEAIRLLARTEGLLIDPVYTGKAFAGMLDYIRTGRVAAGSHVVFWHTGGATALFAEKAIRGDLEQV